MLWDQEKKMPSYKKIAMWVLIAHLGLILFLQFKKIKQENVLKPKLAVNHFVARSPKSRPVVSSQPKAVQPLQHIAAQKKPAVETSKENKWEEKRENFLKGKLENFSKIKKNKEWAEKKEKENLKSLVEKDRVLNQKKSSDAEKKTSQRVLKKIVSHPKNGNQKKRSVNKRSVNRSKAPRRQEKDFLQTQKKRELLKKSLSFLEKTENLKGKSNTAREQAFAGSRTKSNLAQKNNNLSVPVLENNRIFQFSLEETEGFSDLEQEEFAALLVNFFKENLFLPQKGRVKLKLQLSSLAKVQEVQILESENLENQTYLQNTLILLNLDFLKDYLKKEKSFIITFLSEEKK